jgi:hypothetical protein
VFGPRTRRSELLAAVGANLFPLLGVLVFDWSLAVLLVAYWLELGVAFGWAVVRAFFAQRRTDYPTAPLILGAFGTKRGSVPVPVVGFEFRIQHLFAVAMAAVAMSVLWVGVGLITVGGVTAAVGPTALTRDGRAATLLLTAVALVVSRGLRTAAYLRSGRYEDVSAGAELRAETWPLLVIGIALIVGSTAIQAGGSGGAVLVALVGLKFVFDLTDVYSDRLRAWDDAEPLDVGWDRDGSRPSSVRPLETRPSRTARPHRGALLVGGIARGVRSEPIVLVGFLVLGALGTLFVGSLPAAALFAAGAGAVLTPMMAAGVLDRLIRYLTMEYRLGDGLVGYDRLLGEPQWRVPPWRVANADIVETGVDSLFGTSTLELSDGQRTFRAPYLRDAEMLREAADTPPESDG